MGGFDGLTAESRFIHDDEVLKRRKTFQGFHEALKSWPAGKLSAADAIILIYMLIGNRPASTSCIVSSTRLLSFNRTGIFTHPCLCSRFSDIDGGYIMYLPLNEILRIEQPWIFQNLIEMIFGNAGISFE